MLTLSYNNIMFQGCLPCFVYISVTTCTPDTSVLGVKMKTIDVIFSLQNILYILTMGTPTSLCMPVCSDAVNS